LPVPSPAAVDAAAAQWTGKKYAAAVSRLIAAEAAADEQQILQSGASILNTAERAPLISGYSLYSFYSLLSYDLVPGYLKLEADEGQFAALERLFQRQLESGDCGPAARTWTVLHRLRLGGSLEELPPMPLCREELSYSFA
jgi:hypothetical protein